MTNMASDHVLELLEQYDGQRVRLTNEQGYSHTGLITVHRTSLRNVPGIKPEFRDDVVVDVRLNGTGFSHCCVARIDVMGENGRYAFAH